MIKCLSSVASQQYVSVWFSVCLILRVFFFASLRESFGHSWWGHCIIWVIQNWNNTAKQTNKQTVPGNNWMLISKLLFVLKCQLCWKSCFSSHTGHENQLTLVKLPILLLLAKAFIIAGVQLLLILFTCLPVTKICGLLLRSLALFTSFRTFGNWHMSSICR